MAQSPAPPLSSGFPSIHPLLHGLSARRCPMSPHFLTRCLSRLLGLALVSWAFARVGVHRPSLRLPYLGVFVSLFFPCHWISFVYFLRWYLHPTTNPPPYSRRGTGTTVIGYPKRLRYHGMMEQDQRNNCACHRDRQIEEVRRSGRVLYCIVLYLYIYIASSECIPGSIYYNIAHVVA